jgi:hypothetical protein
LITYFLKDDLDKVKKAMAERVNTPEYTGWIHLPKLAKDVGVSERTIRRAFPAYNKQHRNVKPAAPVAKDMPAKSIDGRALPRSYVPKAFADWFQQKRKVETKPDQITREEAAAILGKSRNAVYQLILREKLHAVPGRIPCKGGYPREGIWLSRAEVEDYRHAERAKYGPQAEKARKEKAKNVLTSLLGDRKRHLRSGIISQAVSSGVRQELVYWAKGQLGIQTVRDGLGPAYWIWNDTTNQATTDGNESGSVHQAPQPQPPHQGEEFTKQSAAVILSHNAQDFLDHLFNCQAWSPAFRITVAEAAGALEINAGTLGRTAANLKAQGFVESQEGRDGGYWLTDLGIRVVKQTRQ